MQYESDVQEPAVVQAAILPPVSIEEISASNFLSDNQAYFGLLFELLTHENIDRDKVCISCEVFVQFSITCK